MHPIHFLGHWPVNYNSCERAKSYKCVSTGHNCFTDTQHMICLILFQFENIHAPKRLRKCCVISTWLIFLTKTTHLPAFVSCFHKMCLYRHIFIVYIFSFSYQFYVFLNSIEIFRLDMLLELPNEILYKVIQYTDGKSRLKLESCHKRLQAVIRKYERRLTTYDAQNDLKIHSFVPFEIVKNYILNRLFIYHDFTNKFFFEINVPGILI